MGRETLCRTAHHSNEVVLQLLNRLICQVAPLIIYRENLVGRACLFYFQSVRRVYLIVQYLVSRYYALRFHPFEGAAPGQDHLPLCLVFHGFNPGGAAIIVMQDHLVSISLARPVRELPCLVCVHGPLGFINIDEDIAFFSNGGDSLPGCGALTLVESTPWR